MTAFPAFIQKPLYIQTFLQGRIVPNENVYVC